MDWNARFDAVNHAMLAMELEPTRQPVADPLEAGTKACAHGQARWCQGCDTTRLAAAAMRWASPARTAWWCLSGRRSSRRPGPSCGRGSARPGHAGRPCYAPWTVMLWFPVMTSPWPPVSPSGVASAARWRSRYSAWASAWHIRQLSLPVLGAL